MRGGANFSNKNCVGVSNFQGCLFSCDTGCQLRIADGEADPMVAQCANELGCPVLANDADFFIFPLNGGFIFHGDDLFRYRNRKFEAKVFRQDEFVRKLFSSVSGPTRDLCFLIPALIGNDFMDASGVITSAMVPRYTDCYSCKGKDNAVSRVHAAVNYIRSENVRSIDEYMIKCRHRKTVQNIEQCKYIYSSERQAPNAAIIGKALPDWILLLHRGGRLPLYITQALVSSRVMMKILTDSPNEPTSSALSSRRIRQFIYAIFGLRNVTEFFPKDGDLVSESVLADDVSLERVQDMQMNDFLFHVLKIRVETSELFRQPIFKVWYLVAASLQYWTKYKQRSEAHAKALILSMVECFYSDDTGVVHLPSYSKDSWLSALHAFSEWQFIYHDMCVANTLTGSPLDEISSCKLYDGQKAVLYSLQSEHARIHAWNTLARSPMSNSLLEYLSSASGVRCIYN